MTRSASTAFSGHSPSIPTKGKALALWRAVARVYRRARRDCPQLPEPKLHAIAVSVVMTLRPDLGWWEAQEIANAVIAGLSARYPNWFWEKGPEAMRVAPEGWEE